MMGDVGSGDEGRRQAYLAALGVPLWTARFDLPGAATSLPLQSMAFVAAADIESAVDVAPVAANVESSATVMPAEVPAAALPQTPVVSPSSTASFISAERPATAPPFADPSSTDAPRFALRVQALAPGWLGVVSLGDVPDLSAREYQLLAGLAEALGAAPDFTAPIGLLRWPLNRNPRLDHGAAAAVEWLSHALRVPEGWRCLVLGDAAVHVRAAVPAAVPVTAGPALAAMLATPVLKKSLWRALHG
ncbi:MAG: hypothetical protein Q8J78_12175 [Moraxellaceae bacterium]|nr:hypothetical protein [Moraxellaceae bacterium]